MTLPWFKPEPIRVLPLPDIAGLPDGIYVHPFGMMVALAVLVGVLVASARARREGIHPRILGELAGHVLIGGFVLGHVLDAIFYHWDTVVENPLFVLQLWNGLSSFGGFVGAVVGGAIWSVRRGYSLLAFADPIAYSFPFGWVFGRLGCFLAHDHPGAVSSFPLAVADYRVPGMLPPWEPRHDLGLYEGLFTVAVAGVFFALGRRRRARGFYLALLPLAYAPVRFALDFLRATDVPQADPRLLGLTPGHYGALALLLVGVAVALRVWRGPEPEIPSEARWPEPILEASDLDPSEPSEPSDTGSEPDLAPPEPRRSSELTPRAPQDQSR